MFKYAIIGFGLVLVTATSASSLQDNIEVRAEAPAGTVYATVGPYDTMATLKARIAKQLAKPANKFIIEHRAGSYFDSAKLKDTAIWENPRVRVSYCRGTSVARGTSCQD